ncbi:hypothetical protein E3A20_22360, partial [Planctomyces bekefii]
VYSGFIAFMVLLLFNLNAANLHLPDAAGQRLSETLPSGFFKQFLNVIPVGLLSAVVIFVVFPRARTLSLGLDKIGLKGHVGYSGLVTLSGSGEIESSEQITMLVGSYDSRRTLRFRTSPLLLRGDALNFFDGKVWQNNISNWKPMSGFTRNDLDKIKGRSESVSVQLEPLGVPALFYPGELRSVQNASIFAVDYLVNSNGTVNRRLAADRRIEYNVSYVENSRLDKLSQKTLVEVAQDVQAQVRQRSESERGIDDLKSTLDFPGDLREAAFFKDFVSEVAIDPAQMTMDQAVRKLSLYFNENFKYSLRNSFSLENPLEAFLSKDRTGHCEYFATASALLFRALGIPSRLVVGYKGGVYNEYIDRLEIRESDAHAWVEVYIPTVGWASLDTTPSIQAGQSWATELRRYSTALAFWFREYVVDYNADAQMGLVQSLRGLGERDREGPIDWKKDGMRIARTVGILALIGVLIAWYRNRRRRIRKGKSALPAYYHRFMELARRRGMNPMGGETFARFHKRLESAGLEVGLVRDVDHALERDLYGPEKTDEVTRSQLLLEIERELRAEKRA